MKFWGSSGPNGAGKTTTMRIITGYMPATDGKATVAGFDVFDQPLEAKRRTGYLPETPPLYPDMTVREYLRFVAKIKGVRDERQRSRRRGDEEDVGRRHGRPPLRQALEGLQAARRPRPGADPRARSARPRRADRRPRPQADHRDAPADSRARRHPHHRAEHAHPARSRADLPEGRDHQQGQGRRHRHAARR